MRRPLLSTALAAALALVVPAAALAGLSAPSQASTQECNTRCQIAQTECQLRCDGHGACVHKCQEAARTCVEGCTGDAGSAGDAGSPADAAEGG
jgi:coenzyme F420-reducing hydrogenase gamma subunit